MSLPRALLPPLAAFLLARGLLVAAAVGTERPPWHAGSWSGPDSAHYLSIARGGYTISPCSLDDPPPGVCGNAGWMPLYPWLMRPLLALGVPSPRWVAAGVAAALAFAALAALWTLFLSSWPRHGPLVLLVAAFFPGQVFLHGAFPMGLLVAAVLVSLRLALDGHWTGAGLAGAAAALSHSVGWLLCPVLLVWGLASREPGGRGKTLAGAPRRGPLVAAALTMAGFGATLVLQGVTLGVWDAYFRVQGAYGHHVTSPLATWWAAARGILVPPWAGADEGPSVQAVVVAGLAIAALAAAARRRDREALLVALYVAVVWLFPLALGGTVSVYRTDAALLPAVLLARDAPRPVLAGLLVVLVPLAWVMARLFFELRLV